jgi:hypothetical protein
VTRRSLGHVANYRGLISQEQLGRWSLAIHLAAFCAVAWLCFRYNINGLFYHYDGVYAIVDAIGQTNSRHGAFELSTNFAQSIGSIQILSNKKLFFFFWLFDLIPDLVYAKLAIYLAIGLALFLAVYAMARLLAVERPAALLAAWTMSALAMPFVPIATQPIFYSILWVAPQYILALLYPPIVFALIRQIGRSGIAIDALCAMGVLGLGLYLLGISPPLSVVIGLGALPYVIMALAHAQGRAEIRRKLLFIAAVCAIAVLLRWPSYLFGIFAYTAAYTFPEDFTAVYRHPLYVSLLFQGPAIGWAGPILVGSSIVGALLYLRSPIRALRIGAKTLLGVLAGLMVVLAVYTYASNWILPPPLYVEISFWPLYATFAAVAVSRAARGVAALARIDWVSPGAFELLFVPVAAAGLLVAAHARAPTASIYPLPPSRPAIVEKLATVTAMGDGRQFQGRVVTLIPVDRAGGDAWAQQVAQLFKNVETMGNDLHSLGLWWYQIPTLFEYTPFSSPAMHALKKRTLQGSEVPHQRNITVYTRLNRRILELLGVRFVIQATDAAPPSTSEGWQLSELPDANLGTYTPTIVEFRPTMESSLDLVALDDFDPKKVVVTSDAIEGALLPAERSTLYFEGEDLRLVAESKGRTLVIVPREFSHCLELHANATQPRGSKASIHRVDGILTGVLFEGAIDAVLSFRVGPLHNATCRFEDYQELKAQLANRRE